MNSGERNYLLRRAEIEIEAAQRSIHEKAVRAHYTLAGLYLDKVHRDAGDVYGHGVKGHCHARTG